MSAMNGAGSNSLNDYIEQLEEIEDDQRALARTKRKLLADAAEHGLHVGALKDAVRHKRQSPQQAEALRRRQAALNRYLEELGLRADPLKSEQVVAAPRATAPQAHAP